MNIYEKVLKVQTELKAPKGQYNDYGRYKYRSCEDILEGVKPLLYDAKLLLSISDELMLIGDRYYIKSIVLLIDVEKPSDIITSSAYAREEQNKKGMDGSQITGASSSYARKYALNGIFAIDDAKDSDSTNTQGKGVYKTQDAIELTDKQIKRLYSLAKSKDVSEEDVKLFITKNYKKISTKELTKKEYEELVKRLESK